MSNQNEIWVLGQKSTKADKSFSWWEKIPNITDADVVILDLGALPSSFIQQPPNSALHQNHSSKTINVSLNSVSREAHTAQEHMASLRTTVIEQLRDKILGNGHVVYLLHHTAMFKCMWDNEQLIPYNIKMTKMAERTKISYKDQQFKEYLKEVKSVNYVLDIPEISFNPLVKVNIDNDYLVTDKSNRVVGAALSNVTFLPSLASDTTTEMVDIIVSVLRGHKTEPPPSWRNNIKIAGQNDIKNQIKHLELKKSEISKRIFNLKDKQMKLDKYYSLLYATGNQLEESVKAAFVLLGFDEINNERGVEKEDWRIELKSVPDVKFGVLEVKGRIKKTSMRDIVQCNRWVDDYSKMDPYISVKGIFISNQFRLHEFPKSQDRRKHFEPNEIKYAETRNICIIPSFVLFESANKALSDGPPDRNTVEKLMLNTNGVLKQLWRHSKTHEK